MLFSEPCGNLECKDDTDTCTDGVCECGSGTSLICDAKSEFPLCSNSTCACSKVKRKYEKGDGTTQGSCKSRLHKCFANGECAECINDSHCTGLSNKCKNNICVCGESSGPCDSTTSNECKNNICMCGQNPQCYQKIQTVEKNDVGTSDSRGVECKNTLCSYDGVVLKQCVVQRGPEVCEKITKYYNPLYSGKAVNADGSPAATACDDEKGKYLGTYQCLGNINLINQCYVLYIIIQENVHSVLPS